MDSALCPCQSGRAYGACCGPYHRGEGFAQTAEALMRSRYSAYALGLAPYVQETWHPTTRPADVELDQGPVKWLGLDVRRTAQGGADDAEGVVEFVARYKVNGKAHRLHEISRFVREDGRWFYVDGQHPQ